MNAGTEDSGKDIDGILTCIIWMLRSDVDIIHANNRNEKPSLKKREKWDNRLNIIRCVMLYKPVTQPTI